ncbi:hypothetical protein C8R45DRAFT_254430 [Mycena sanguinolenta]|nr:hypothetical protein C8R45DRAFT_254430 [Mycena sanguinolenta]
MHRYRTHPSLDYSSPATSPLESPIYGVVSPDEQLDMKMQLHDRLSGGRLSNMPAGFPFRHVMDPRGTPRICYDPYEFREELRSPRRNGRNLSAHVSFFHENAVPYVSKNSYLSWCAHASKLDLLPYTRGPPPKVPAAHVRVDTRVMDTAYGKYIERDPQIILHALSISLELGLLVTITAQKCDDAADLYSIIYIGTANNGRQSVVFNAGSFRRR